MTTGPLQAPSDSTRVLVVAGKPAVAIWHRLGFGKPRVCLGRVDRLPFDTRAVTERGLVDRVSAPVVSPVPVGSPPGASCGRWRPRRIRGLNLLVTPERLPPGRRLEGGGDEEIRRRYRIGRAYLDGGNRSRQPSRAFGVDH